MPGSQWEISGGWRRYFFDTGAGEQTVVFLHGIPTNHLLWRSVVEVIRPDMRAVAPDLTGFGRSDLPREADLSPRGQAADILAFLDRRGVDSFTLVAHDYGFLVACEVLAGAAERVERLVATNSSIRAADWSGAALNPFRLVALPVVGEVAFYFARRWMLRLAFLPFVADRDKFTDEFLDAFWEPFEHDFSTTLLRLFRNRSVNPSSERRWRDALEAFGGPVTIVWGTRDPAFRTDRVGDIVELVPHATTIMLVNSNHFVPLDRPRVLARLINAQIDGS